MLDIHQAKARLARLSFLPALAVVTGLMLVAAGTEGVPPATAATPMVVKGAAATVPGGTRELARVAPDTTVRLSVVLDSSDPEGLEQLAQDISVPGRPQFRQYLSPAQVQARFGPAPGVLDSTRSWLEGQGLSVGATVGDGLVLPVSGTAATVETALHTQLSEFELADGLVRYANTVAPELPADLAPSVAAVVGLDNLAQIQTGLTEGHGPAEGTRGATATPAASPVQASGPTACSAAADTANTFTAGQLAYAYQFNALYGQGHLGQGITVALFEQADYLDSDVDTYLNCYGIGTSVTRVPVDGGTNIGANPNGDAETTADIETLAGMAPDVHILAYEGPSSNPITSTLDLYATIAQQNLAQVVSTSWGYCEPQEVGGGYNVATLESPLFEEMAVQGQSFLAATGDEGSEACTANIGAGGVNHGSSTNPYGLTVQDPASQPYATAVGGTAITTLSSPPVQSAWNQTGPDENGAGWTAPFDGGGSPARHNGYPGNLAGTGGISQNWQMPPWQVGADTSGNSSGSPCGAPVGVDCREVPDVSALAAAQLPATPGYALYGTAGGFRDIGWGSFGGTSLATPLWAALTALADQGTPGQRLGLLAPSLYQISQSTPSALTGVTSGNNDYLAPDSTVPAATPGNYTCTYGGVHDLPCYEATPGYNMATGLGTPVGGVLASALDALQVGITTTSLPGGVAGRPYSAAVAVANGTPPYTWAVMSGSLPPGLRLDQATGVISGTPTAVGTSSFSVRVADDGGPPVTTMTATFSITVSSANGYWLTGSDGGVFAYGGAGYFGSMGGQPLNKPIVGLAATPDGGGYWEVAADGGLFAFGDAGFYGSMGGKPLNQPIVGLAATPDGLGYWEVAADGGLFAFGDAGFYGSMGGKPLNQPIVGLAATPDGGGYWEVAADGGLFAFGDAGFYGSMGGKPLNQPIVGLAATPDGGGYWVVGADGGVFTFGDAGYFGSMGGHALAASVVGLAASPDGGGYWEVAADGGVFTYGDAAYFGAASGLALTKPVVGLAPDL